MTVVALNWARFPDWLDYLAWVGEPDYIRLSDNVSHHYVKSQQKGTQ